MHTMASASPAIVLYAGSAATYVCEAGDVQPTYPHLQPITEDLLKLLHSASAQTVPAAVADRQKTRLGGGAVAALRQHLVPLLRHRTVFLVLPLASSASYQEEWVRWCFHADVAVRRLLVLSDTVADSFACGQDSCVVLHASLHTISVSRVKAGCSTRYGNSRVGSVQGLCGEAAAAKLAAEVSRVAAALSVQRCGSGSDDEEEGASAADSSARGAEASLMVDLSAAEYRNSLVHAFGYQVYRAVIAVPQQERLRRAAQGTGKGKGKGRGASTPSLLDALKQAYPREVRHAPGQVEKLVARVAQGVVSTPSVAESEPCILAGEALAVPYMTELLRCVLRRCGDKTWTAVEHEQRARQRRLRAQRGDADGTYEAEATAAKRHKTESSEDTSTSSSTSSSSSASDEESEEDEDVWLHLQPTPLPTAPWWLPLLGASLVSRLPESDLQRITITEDEARESNGTIVHWKMLQ